MKAVVCRQFGPPETLALEELPSPVPGEGEVVVSVKAASVNFPDVLIIQNKYQFKPPLPFSPGSELAGVVKQVGAGVTGAKAGDRIIAFTTYGAFAEEVKTEASRLLPLPAGMDFRTGASFLLTYSTSEHALRDRGELKAGETLLVLGAAGGVGLTAVEIGRAMGARVIAAASSAEKLAAARAHGAHESINYATEKLTERVMALTSEKGADVCFDPVGGELFDAALSSLGWGGRILLVGFVGGVPSIPANRLLVKNRAALGSSLRYYRWHQPDKFRRSVDELLAWYGQGKLHPLVTHRLPLEESVEGIRLLTGRKAHGKIVVTMGAA